MEYLIKGRFKKGDILQNFSKKVNAETEKKAVHKVLSKIGSDYKCNRHLIKIDSIEEIKNE
jgi:ribosomal protein L20A (L18A)